jgi:hypothetical protein
VAERRVGQSIRFRRERARDGVGDDGRITAACFSRGPSKILLGDDPSVVLARSDLKPGGHQKVWDNPMDTDFGTRFKNLRLAPRCGARTHAGTSCQRPAMNGKKRCRLHGGLSPGAPRGFRNGNFKNGDWTADAITERKWLRSLVQSFVK